MIDKGLIEATTKSVATISSLGGNGFILFAIIIVALLFVFSVWVAYRFIQIIMANHKANEKRIDEAHERIYKLEDRENACLEELTKVTDELKECLDRIKERND